MNKLLALIVFVLFLISCHPDASISDKERGSNDKFHSEYRLGQWTTDPATKEELRAIYSTIDNFSQLNKRKFENLKAYQEFGSLLQSHTETIKSNRDLTGESQEILLKKISMMEKQLRIFGDTSLTGSRMALDTIQIIFSEIDSTFEFDF